MRGMSSRNVSVVWPDESELTDQELSALVAEKVMGWPKIAEGVFRRLDGCNVCTTGDRGVFIPQFSPSSRHDHAHEVTLKAIERWGARQFIETLYLLSNPEETSNRAYLALIATPRLKCLAALACATAAEQGPYDEHGNRTGHACTEIDP